MTFPGRRADDGVAWLSSRPQEERARVEVVGLEMSKTYAAAIEEGVGDPVQVIDLNDGEEPKEFTSSGW